MSKHDDGGPAFPVGVKRTRYDSYACTEEVVESDFEPGMSLRDWFAGQALVGIGTWCPQFLGEMTWPEPFEVAKRRAEWAYDQADAMLAARKQDPRA